MATFGEFTCNRPEVSELAKKSVSSTFPTLRTMNSPKNERNMDFKHWTRQHLRELPNFSASSSFRLGKSWTRQILHYFIFLNFGMFTAPQFPIIGSNLMRLWIKIFYDFLTIKNDVIVSFDAVRGKQKKN